MKSPHVSRVLLGGVIAIRAFAWLSLPLDSYAATDVPAEVANKGNIVQSDKPSPSIPPEGARYLHGPIPEGRQFAFLIGQWDVDATRFDDQGSVLFRYKAIWRAKYLNEGRMIMDDFEALAPDGRPISSYVTLRTYSESTCRWEMAGLAALQPAVSAEWHGVWIGHEMRLDASGVDPSGRHIKTKIRFSDITPERFLWESRSSVDDGKTWTLTAALVATRVVAESP